jgi:hypothetical protein
MVQRHLRSNEKSQVLHQISNKVERRRKAKKHEKTLNQIGKPGKKEIMLNIADLSVLNTQSCSHQ